MGLEAIVDAIASESDLRVTEIRTDAETRSNGLLVEAREAGAIDQDHWAHARDEEAARVSARIVNRGQLVADRLLAQAREDLFQETLDRLHAKLGEVVASPAYDAVLRALYVEAAEAVPDPDATVLVRKADQDLMERLLVGAGRVDGSLECSGGVDLETTDGLAVRNTLDARVTRSQQELRHLAVQMIPDLVTGVVP